jgi:hypothetical protein
MTKIQATNRVSTRATGRKAVFMIVKGCALRGIQGKHLSPGIGGIEGQTFRVREAEI